MHPHYYWLKKSVRNSHNSHLFAYKINAVDFKGKENIEVLQKVFNISSYQELNDTYYIAVNQDKLKLPVGGRLSGDMVSSSIAVKFITNPLKVNNEDELFDIFDSNRSQPIKYFAMLNTTNKSSDPNLDMKLEQKMFRKFFYENSSFIDSECVFIEITDKELAKNALGIESEHEVLAIQNKNKYSKFI